MGKSCVRFRRLEDVPLEVVGEAIARTSVDDFIAAYERSRADLTGEGGRPRGRPLRLRYRSGQEGRDRGGRLGGGQHLRQRRRRDDQPPAAMFVSTLRCRDSFAPI